MLKLKKVRYDKKLLQVMSINSVSVIVRLISGFIFSKFVAIYLGPNGIGQIGNLRSLLNGLQSLGGLGFNNGVIKYASQYKEDKVKLTKLLSTVFFTCLFAVFSLTIILFFLKNYWSLIIFNSDQYSTIITCLAFSLPFLIGNYLCLAVLNGFSKYKLYTIVNIISSIVGLILSLTLLFKYNLFGVLLSLVIVPVLLFLISLRVLLLEFNIFNYLKWSFYDKGILKKISEYSLMALVTVVTIPPTLIAIRNHVTLVDGIEKMGLCEAMNRISNYYLVFVTSLLSLYLYPKLSKVNSNSEFRAVIFSFYKTIFPIVFIGLICIYLFKTYVIKLVLSKQFLQMEPLFSWQLTGDLFKILSSVLAYQFMAKKLTKTYVITELLSAFIWYTSSVFFINKYGYVGASMGYFVCYSTYFIILVFCFRKPLFGRI